MSESLTTGRMIDQLKVGQVAETNTHGYARVIKNEDGSITHDDVGGNLVIGTRVSNLKWRILPDYVSFEEAMKALKNGKRVSFTYVNENDYEETIYFESNYGAKSSLRREIEWMDLFDKKWTIEGENK